jgi:uncharacterized protein involved in response to NO
MSRSLPLSTDLPEPAARTRPAFAAKGFRPFFLLAGLFAVAIVPSWVFIRNGGFGLNGYLEPMTWHAHEMVFGFAVAVIAGFLLTAVGNWTRRETLVGTPLLALAGLWVLGRIAMIVGSQLPRALPALVELAFLPLLAATLARPLIATANRRNYPMLAVLAALFCANLVVHLDALGVITHGFALRACQVAVDVVILLILVVAGRVFPMFTRNATGVESIRSNASLDSACVGAMLMLTLSDAFAAPPALAAAIAGLTAVLAAARAWHWGAQHSLREPLLWILHAGYVWLILGFTLRALSAAGAPVGSSLGTHALTTGAIGSLTLGMMTRVSLGHTGRLLRVSPAMTCAFATINAAAIARVFLPLAAAAWYAAALWLAAALWSAAFLTFVFVHIGMLTAPRVDGKAG